LDDRIINVAVTVVLSEDVESSFFIAFADEPTWRSREGIIFS
jgi:hypothetical protein